jgi:hypothetical protein
MLSFSKYSSSFPNSSFAKVLYTGIKGARLSQGQLQKRLMQQILDRLILKLKMQSEKVIQLIQSSPKKRLASPIAHETKDSIDDQIQALIRAFSASCSSL